MWAGSGFSEDLPQLCKWLAESRLETENGKYILDWVSGGICATGLESTDTKVPWVPWYYLLVMVSPATTINLHSALCFRIAISFKVTFWDKQFWFHLYLPQNISIRIVKYMAQRQNFLVYKCIWSMICKYNFKKWECASGYLPPLQPIMLSGLSWTDAEECALKMQMFHNK